jgi:tetratricopeptide (TPR) repeat protein
MRLLSVWALFLLQADHYAEGMKALEARDYPAAIAAFEKAAAADEKDFASQFHLGLAHSLVKNDDKAILHYQKALELKPDLYEAKVNLSVLYLDTGKAAAAIPVLKSALETKSKEFRPNYYLAVAYLRAGQLDDAEAQLKVTRQLDPASADVKSSYLELAAQYEKAKQLPKAVAIYQEFPDVPGARERVGELMLESGKTEDAIPQLDAAVKQSPTAANRFALATAYLRAKQTEKATQMMDQAVAADPNNAELRIAYGGLLRDQRNFQGAAQQFWAATKLKADSRDGWSGLATMLLSLENYPQAIAAFDKLESLGDPNPGLHFLRALAYDKTKNYKPALASYERFLEVAGGKFPDEEFKARQRIKVIKKELSRR